MSNDDSTPRYTPEASNITMTAMAWLEAAQRMMRLNEQARVLLGTDVAFQAVLTDGTVKMVNGRLELHGVRDFAGPMVKVQDVTRVEERGGIHIVWLEPEDGPDLATIVTGNLYGDP